MAYASSIVDFMSHCELSQIHPSCPPQDTWRKEDMEIKGERQRWDVHSERKSDKDRDRRKSEPMKE
jgi:hypothetical protein